MKVRIVPTSYADLTEGRPEHYSPFRPGMTATVDIITNKRKNIIAVPISAIVVKNDTTDAKRLSSKDKNTVNDEKFECVYVKNGGEAKLRVVTTGIQDDTNIQVLTGLKEGDVVITGPYNLVTKTLKSGDKVELKTEKSTKDEDSE